MVTFDKALGTLNLNLQEMKTQGNSYQSSFQNTDRTHEYKSTPSAGAHIRHKKPPTTISHTTKSSQGSRNTAIDPSKSPTGIRQFLYNTSLQNGTLEGHTERSGESKSAQTRKEMTPKEQPMMLLSHFKSTPTGMSESKHIQFVNQLRDLINLEPKLEDHSLSTFEVLETLITLKQNHSFARRCQKLKRMRKEHRLRDSSQLTFAGVADEN
jgi:hypothetical protein